MSDPLAMDAQAIERFLVAHFPQAAESGQVITRCDERGLAVALDTTAAHLRPGGTVSGPTLMTLADTAAYFAILSRIGPRALAVTSSLEIHFLRKPMPGRITADAQILKLGRRLAVVMVTLDHADHADALAFSTVTYAIPEGP